MLAGPIISLALCSPPAFAAAPPKSVSEFVERVAAAIDDHDAASLEALFYPTGVTSTQKANHGRAVRKWAKNKVAKTTLMDLVSKDTDDFAVDGVTYRLNLKGVKRLELAFAGKPRAQGASMLIGVTDDGSYYIATHVPPGAPTAPSPEPAWGADGSERDDPLWDACGPEIGFLCEQERRRRTTMIKCLRENHSALTPRCQAALQGLE